MNEKRDNCKRTEISKNEEVEQQNLSQICQMTAKQTNSSWTGTTQQK